MAKTGLSNLVFAKIKENGKYEAPKSIGKGVSVSVTPSVSDAKLYADDSVAETATAFSGAGVSITIDDDRTDVMATLLGHSISGEEIVRKASDVAPYVGFGQIVEKTVGGVRKFKVEFLAKVQFKEPNQEASTKGESVEFKTTTLEGTAIAPEGDEPWSKSKTFDQKQQAVEYLTACFVQA